VGASLGFRLRWQVGGWVPFWGFLGVLRRGLALFWALFCGLKNFSDLLHFGAGHIKGLHSVAGSGGSAYGAGAPVRLLCQQRPARGSLLGDNFQKNPKNFFYGANARTPAASWKGFLERAIHGEVRRICSRALTWSFAHAAIWLKSQPGEAGLLEKPNSSRCARRRSSDSEIRISRRPKGDTTLLYSVVAKHTTPGGSSDAAGVVCLCIGVSCRAH
jgi:hypothetical protein